MQDQKSSLTIKLEDFPSNPVFIGEKSRLGSATSVAFLDSNTIACAHFSGEKLYVYRFDLDKNIYDQISEIDTTYDGRNCRTDLMAYDGKSRIVLTNFFENTCSIYYYDGKNIDLLKYCPYNAGDVVHGVKFYSDEILAVTSRRDVSGVHFFKTDEESPIFILKSDRRSVQDLCIIADNKLALISTSDSPKMQPHKMWSSHIDIIGFDLDNKSSEILYSLEIKNSHMDNVVYVNSNLYISDQYNNAVLVFDCENLSIIKRYEGFNFPHGIAVGNNMLAVSNYGSNTVEIRMI